MDFTSLPIIWSRKSKLLEAFNKAYKRSPMEAGKFYDSLTPEAQRKLEAEMTLDFLEALVHEQFQVPPFSQS